jgi:hypothetical protein
MRHSILWLVMMVQATVALPSMAQVVDNPHGSFREDCRMCHTPNSWSPMRVDATFDHDKTGFALRGAHADTPCLLCHDTLEFKTVQGSQCADCHQDVHLGELGIDCARCHTTKDFIDRSEALRQHRTSRFPLTGAHLSTDCAACHLPVQGSPMRFLNTPMECDACHAQDFRAASNPDHVAAGFPMDCSQCHSTRAWGGGDFDHALTGFALTGAHKTAQCQSCHTDLAFSNTVSSECASCHLEEAQAAADPDHSGFPTDCSQCHSTSAWAPAMFDHDATSFPLSGAHRAVSCIECHTDGVYTGTPQDCYACHDDDFNATTDPAHVASGFSTDCLQCHSTNAWEPATFNHDATAFPLTGAHRTVSCTECHTNGTYAGTPQDCFACHEADYNATSQPQHTSAGFGIDCATCHDTNQWLGATFDHDATFFPIYSGRHSQAWNDCSDCHVNPSNYAQFECILCHEHSNEADLADTHRGRSDYQFLSSACYFCHPDGRE